MSTYTELIEELRRLAKSERESANECFCDPEYAPALDKAAAAIETLSRGMEAYAKANAELTAWKENAQDWMQRVVGEKAAAEREGCGTEPDPEEDCNTVAPDVFFICDRRACDHCNPDCHLTVDIRHAEHFEVTPYGNFTEKEDRA